MSEVVDLSAVKAAEPTGLVCWPCLVEQQVGEGDGRVFPAVTVFQGMAICQDRHMPQVQRQSPLLAPGPNPLNNPFAA